MGRWTPDEHGCIYDETGCFARLTPNKAERLASRHNADIDALTTERDELQRRLAEVVDAMRPTDEDDRLREFSNAACDRYGFKQSAHRRAVAIAEGRLREV